MSDLSPEVEIEPEQALAELLRADVVFLNSHWWETDWPKEAQECIAVAVNCNDSFAPAADAEELPYVEIERLYAMWKHDPTYGPVAWCAWRRKAKHWRTRQRGAWDWDALARGELPEKFR